MWPLNTALFIIIMQNMDHHQSKSDIVVGKSMEGLQSQSQEYPQIKPARPVFLSSANLYDRARLQFVRKVYTILSIQLLITVGMTIAAMYSKGFLDFQLNNQWLMWTCLVLIIMSEIVILFVPAGRRLPLNMICLLIFTLAESYMVSFICSITAENDAAVMTLGIVLATTLFALFTKTEYNLKWAILIVLICGLLSMTIFMVLFTSQWANVIYCTIGVILFGIYLIIDTQMILGGGRMSISIDDYVAAAMFLYIDIIQIFLYILSMLGER